MLVFRNETQRFNVELVRFNLQSSFGFGMGTSEDGEKIISKVNESGPASGKLAIDDVILSINGMNAFPLTHAEAIAEISSGLKVSFEVERVPGAARRFTVVISRNTMTESFGFGLGTSETNEKIVSSVRAGGPSDGKLVQEDVIIEINGNDVTELSHQETIGHASAALQFLLLSLSSRRGCSVSTKT